MILPFISKWRLIGFGKRKKNAVRVHSLGLVEKQKLKYRITMGKLDWVTYSDAKKTY